MDQLRIRKKLLEQQLAVTQSRCQRMGKCLEERKKGKGKDDRSSTQQQAFKDENVKEDWSIRLSKRKVVQGTNAAAATGEEGPSHRTSIGLAGEPIVIQRYSTGKQLGSATLAPRLMIERRRQELLKDVAKELEHRRKEDATAKAAKAGRRRPSNNKGSSNRNNKHGDNNKADAGGKHIAKAAIPRSFFPALYQRGELPCTIIFKSTGKAISWLVPLDALDLEYYLPIFIDGIRCKAEPYKFLARNGCSDLIEAAASQPARVLPSINAIVKGLKYAMSTHDDDTLRAALATTTQLVRAVPEVGKGR